MYGLLDIPWVYGCSQQFFAPGAAVAVTRAIRRLLQRLPPARIIVDVGCGPSSWLKRVGLQPVGVDRSWPYVARYGHGARAVMALADALPFASRSVDAVWSFFLFHHVPDDVARTAVSEMLRICRPGGSVVVCDGVMPRSAWRRPIAYAIRRWDRGAFMRREDEVRSLLPSHARFRAERMTYAFNGLELLMCWAKPDASSVESIAALPASGAARRP